jgi:hypothetical protein
LRPLHSRRMAIRMTLPDVSDQQRLLRHNGCLGCKRYLHRSEGKEAGHRKNLLPPQIRIEVLREGQKEYRDVKNHVGARECKQSVLRFIDSSVSKSVALGWRNHAFVPKTGDWKARKPSHKNECSAPQYYNYEQGQCYDAAITFAEESQVLEQQREFDADGCHDVGSVRDVEPDHGQFKIVENENDVFPDAFLETW